MNNKNISLIAFTLAIAATGSAQSDHNDHQKSNQSQHSSSQSHSSSTSHSSSRGSGGRSSSTHTSSSTGSTWRNSGSSHGSFGGSQGYNRGYTPPSQTGSNHSYHSGSSSPSNSGQTYHPSSGPQHSFPSGGNSGYHGGGTAGNTGYHGGTSGYGGYHGGTTGNTGYHGGTSGQGANHSGSFNNGQTHSWQSGRPVGPTSSQSRYAFTNRTDMRQAYIRESRVSSVQIRNTYIVNNIYQSPQWGGHWRYGFNPSPRYGNGFAFSIGLYLFSPFERPCYVSPWYYYSSMPAYVPVDRCVIVPSYSCNWNVGAPYRYAYHQDAYEGGDRQLDRAIDDIVDIFQNGNVDVVGDLLPNDGQVAIFTEGKYDYSLNDDDFHSMLVDNAKATQTEGFKVTNVRHDGPYAYVNATHVVQNADGGEETVYQRYRLRNESGRYVITDFLTSHSPSW